MKTRDMLSKKFSPHFLCIIVIVVCGFVAYQNSLGGGFLWDDNFFVETNTVLRSWQGIPQAFVHPLHPLYPQYYRPLQIVSYVFDYHVWRLNPFGYHFTNIMAHLCCACLLYFLLATLFTDTLQACLVALIFCVHPVLSESVLYISSRTNVMASTFIIISLLCWIKSTQAAHHCRRYTVWSLFFFTASLFTNEIALVFPLLVLIYSLLLRKPLRVVIYYFFCAGIYGIVRYMVAPPMLNFPQSLGIVNIPAALIFSIKLMFVPLGLHKNWTIGEMIATLHTKVILIMALVGAGMVRFVVTNRQACFGCVWFIISILAALLCKSMPAFLLSEGWFYWASIGFFIALSSFLYRAMTHTILRKVILVIFSITILTFGYLTGKRSIVWGNAGTFYQEMLRQQRFDDERWVNVGCQQIKNYNFSSAELCFTMALRLNPHNWRALEGMGTVFRQKGEYDTALHMFQESLKINGCNTAALNNSAAIYVIRGELDKAISLYEKTLTCNAMNSIAAYNLAILYARRGDEKKALEMLDAYPYIREYFKR